MRSWALDLIFFCQTGMKTTIKFNIITSHGPATAIDVAFLLLESLTSKSNADAVAQLMGFKR